MAIFDMTTGKKKVHLLLWRWFLFSWSVRAINIPTIDTSKWKRWPSQFNQQYYINQRPMHVHHLERCHGYSHRIRTLPSFMPCAVHAFFHHSNLILLALHCIQLAIKCTFSYLLAHYYFVLAVYDSIALFPSLLKLKLLPTVSRELHRQAK